MRISIIVAMSTNRVIGRSNQLPWHLPADLKRFKSLTWGKSIIMGRKTFESIGHALPGRRNIVVTRQANLQALQCDVVNSLEQAIARHKSEDEVMIIGGEMLFKQALPITERIYLTLIHQVIQGDVFFPSFDKSDWIARERLDYDPDEKNRYSYSFINLERKH